MEARRSTLVGVATGTPDGGVAIVRLSGPRARGVAEGLCGAVPPPRALQRRALGLAAGHEDALVVFMPGPRSFTGEDVVELHVHAGARNVRAVLEACLGAGAVAAGPGDFTRRAFELGRMTLDQAEGVAALIGAQTDEALLQARRLMAGEVGAEADGLREQLADLRAEVEANLDFPEDVDPSDVDRWGGEAAQVAGALERWLDGYEAGRRARERTRIVLAGPPNAGKSSVFNALLRQERAIVADVPGTTRDFVEAELELEGYTVVLVDTAGLRETDEVVEAAGVARSRSQLQGADLVVWIEAVDGAPEPRPSGLEGRLLEVESKRDLGVRHPARLGVCSKSGAEGVEALRQAVRQWLRAGRHEAWIGLARHRDCAREALEALARARSGLERGEPLETVAFELATAEGRLGEMTGRHGLGPVGEQVLDRIFSRFCIGK